MQTFLQLLNFKDILLHMLNAAILIVAIRFLLYKPVRKFMGARTEKLTEQITQAEQVQAQAEKAQQDLAAAQQQARVDAARQTAENLAKQSDAVLHKAREDAAQIVSHAQGEAEAIRRQAQEDVQREAVALAVDMTEKMLGRELKDPDNQQMVRDFLTKVG